MGYPRFLLGSSAVQNLKVDREVAVNSTSESSGLHLAFMASCHLKFPAKKCMFASFALNEHLSLQMPRGFNVLAVAPRHWSC